MDERKESKFMAHGKPGTSKSTTMKEAPEELQECVENCTHCSTTCRDTVSHCLMLGGDHAQPVHLWLLLDCAEICQTSAHFMMHNSPLHPSTCQACAEVCEQCAEDCERIPDDQMMEACAEDCRRCAESCSKMAEQQQRRGSTLIGVT